MSPSRELQLRPSRHEETQVGKRHGHHTSENLEFDLPQDVPSLTFPSIDILALKYGTWSYGTPTKTVHDTNLTAFHNIPEDGHTILPFFLSTASFCSHFSKAQACFVVPVVMLIVSRLSGQKVTELDEEILQKLNDRIFGNSVRALKWHLKNQIGDQSGLSLYQLELISGDGLLDNACPLLSLTTRDTADIVLTIVVDFRAPTQAEEKSFLSAVTEGRANDLEILLQLPIDPNAVMSPDYYSPCHSRRPNSALHVAAGNGHLEIVELLLGAGASIDYENFYGETALVYACTNSHIQVMKVLIQRGAEVNVLTMLDQSLCAIALRSGREDIDWW